MKHISIFSSITSRCCTLLLAWLGISCSSDDTDIDYPYICMYGSPTGSFEVKGAVATEDGTPIPDAEIRVTPSATPSGIWSYVTTTTGKDGTYAIKYERASTQDLKIVCLSPDQKLASDSITVPVKYQFDKEHSQDKNNPWYQGHADLTVDIKLKAKPTEEE